MQNYQPQILINYSQTLPMPCSLIIAASLHVPFHEGMMFLDLCWISFRQTDDMQLAYTRVWNISHSPMCEILRSQLIDTAKRPIELRHYSVRCMWETLIVISMWKMCFSKGISLWTKNSMWHHPGLIFCYHSVRCLKHWSCDVTLRYVCN